MPDQQSLDPLVHARYIQALDSHKDELEYWLTEHLRLSGVYWGLTALHLLGRPDDLSRQGLVDFVLACWDASGGFSAAPGHDAHMLYTVSAVQVIALLDAWSEIDASRPGSKDIIAKYITDLQDPVTGTFAGDGWGETDTRFLYGAFNALSLLGHLDRANVPLAVKHIHSCQNLDGAFGTSPGAESHSGQVFTCLGALSIAGRLDIVDADRLGAWLSERQLPNGGLNGRPEKLEDVCYGWWVMSSLAMIDRLHWIDRNKMIAFILKCQDPERGGFADRPGDQVDVFHTVFALAGLSLLKYSGLEEVDPRYDLYCIGALVLDVEFVSFRPISWAVVVQQEGASTLKVPCIRACNFTSTFTHQTLDFLCHPNHLWTLRPFQCKHVLIALDLSLSRCHWNMQQQQQGRPHSMDMHITFPIPPIPTFPMFPRPSSSSIPLSCNICSSKPDFSDTSHLLTHIASKGHLSTYYRIKVKSVNDDVARQLIDDYDAWYATWDIEGLMSERMSLKEKKRRQKTDARVIQSTQPPVIDSTGQYYGPLRLSNPLLDPSLAMGSEKEQAYVLGSTHLYGLSDFSTSYDQLPPPWLHSPSAFEDSHQASQACEMEKYGNPTIEDEEPFPAYGSPTPAPRTFMRGNDIRLQPSMADAADDDDDNDSHPSEVTKLSEVAKLKGIYWPGMDIFDSATPEMRRMRNQKKSTDVVDKLEAASREIEPTEIVYFAHGPIKREQTITGFPHEDSSPLRPTGFSPPVIVQRPPRKPAARKALAPRDPNVRGRGGRRTRSAVNPRTSAGQENNQTVHTKGTDGPRRSRRTKTQTAASLPATLHNPTEMAYLTAGFSQTSHLGAEDHLVTQHYEQTAAHPTHIWTHAFDLPPSDTQEGAWDFLGQQLGGFLANPLYMGSTHEDGQAVEDDQRTISAPGSDA